MIPYGRQTIEDDDIEAVVSVLKSDWLTQGPVVERFEEQLALRSDAGYAVACNSGTAALHMAYAAAEINSDDIVVVPANTFLATANAATYLGARVRFCDVDPQSGLMTAESLRQVLDENVAAIVPVHFAGQPCEMRELNQVREQLCPEAIFIEDASHAIGGRYSDGSVVGSCAYSAMATFSFHPVKHIAAGEGGAVTTNCVKVAEKLKRFRCHGMTKDPGQMENPDEGPWFYEMPSPGFNYRIPETSCALALSQLGKLDRFLDRRREIASGYFERLASVPYLTLPPRAHLATSAWHLFCCHVDFAGLGADRQTLMSQLSERQIGTQVHYFPVAMQPFYRRQSSASRAILPGSQKHYETALSIPLFPSMEDHHIDQVVSALTSTIASHTRRKRIVA